MVDIRLLVGAWQLDCADCKCTWLRMLELLFGFQKVTGEGTLPIAGIFEGVDLSKPSDFESFLQSTAEGQMTTSENGAQVSVAPVDTKDTSASKNSKTVSHADAPDTRHGIEESGLAQLFGQKVSQCVSAVVAYCVAFQVVLPAMHARPRCGCERIPKHPTLEACCKSSLTRRRTLIQSHLCLNANRHIIVFNFAGTRLPERDTTCLTIQCLWGTSSSSAILR